MYQKQELEKMIVNLTKNQIENVREIKHSVDGTRRLWNKEGYGGGTCVDG